MSPDEREWTVHDEVALEDRRLARHFPPRCANCGKSIDPVTRTDDDAGSYCTIGCWLEGQPRPVRAGEWLKLADGSRVLLEGDARLVADKSPIHSGKWHINLYQRGRCHAVAYKDSWAEAQAELDRLTGGVL